MKTRMFKLPGVSVLTLLITALAITSLAAKEKAKPAAAASGSVFATGMKDGGRLVIKRSPSLGNRLIIAMKIDGESVSIGYGQTFNRYVTPGHHTLSVMATPRPQNVEPWQMSLDVQAGKTYTFLAQSGKNRQLVLAK
jgi:hypothetical protein